MAMCYFSQVWGSPPQCGGLGVGLLTRPGWAGTLAGGRSLLWSNTVLRVLLTSLVSVYSRQCAFPGNTKVNKALKSLWSQRRMRICKQIVHLNTKGTMWEICGVQKEHQRENAQSWVKWGGGNQDGLCDMLLKSSPKIWETFCQVSKLGNRVPGRKGRGAQAQMYETSNISWA